MNFEQQLTQLVGKEILHKPKKPSQIIEALKKHGIPGSRAAIYYNNYSVSFLIRKVWHFRYILESSYAKKIKNKRAFFQNLIEYNQFPEPDSFWSWVKLKQADYKKTDYEVLYNNF